MAVHRLCRFGGSEFKPEAVCLHSSVEKATGTEAFPSQHGQCFGNSSVETAHLAVHMSPTPAQTMPQAAEHPRAACLWVSGRSLALEDCKASGQYLHVDLLALPLQARALRDQDSKLNRQAQADAPL